MRKKITFLIVYVLSIKAVGQTSDTTGAKVLEEVKVRTQLNTVERLPALAGTRIWNGKKTEVLNVTGMDANIAEKTPRQIFAKVPGVFVYDMDGSGNQVNSVGIKI